MINAVFPFVDEGFLMRSIHVKIDVRRGQVLPVAVIRVKADHNNLSLIYKSVTGRPSGPSREGPGVGHKIVSDTKQMTKEKKKEKK